MKEWGFTNGKYLIFSLFIMENIFFLIEDRFVRNPS